MINSEQTQLDYKGVFGVEGLKAIWDAISNNWLSKALASIGFALIDAIASCDFLPSAETVTVIFTLIIFDTITGFAKAYKNHVISSSGFFRFALKIVIYFILLATGSILDHVLPIHSSLKALTVVSSFLAITEAISILENIADLGYAVPSKLISLLKLTRKTYNSLDNDDVVVKKQNESK